tara:strand:- start:54060 stop:54248 length:189 start_codon:yes stop_codon:yes gene_type:complete
LQVHRFWETVYTQKTTFIAGKIYSVITICQNRHRFLLINKRCFIFLYVIFSENFKIIKIITY